MKKELFDVMHRWAMLTLIIENWIYVLLAVIIIPFVLYWIAIGLSKLMEFF